LSEKGFGTDVKASFPTDSKPFFSLLRKPAEQAPRTAAVVRATFGCRRFCCGKNERVSRCGAGWENAACGRLHLITASGGASPQGEAFWERGQEKAFPLRGRCHGIAVTDEV